MIKNNRGLTLIEISIGLGVTAILGLITMQFLQDNQRQTKRIEKAIDYKIDTLLADKVLLKDFRLAFPSLNQLQILDDNNRSFYDKYEKIESTTGLDTSGNNTESVYSRSFRLDKNTSNKTIHLLIQDTTRGEILYADPVMFYDVGTPTDINTPAPITFNEYRFMDYINEKNNSMLEPGSLVFIESSVPMPKTAGNYNGRHAAFLAKVSPIGALIAYNPPGDIFSFNIYSKTSTGAEVITPINKIDPFLRELPPSANGGSNIRIVPVRLIRYSMRCDRETAIIGQIDLSGEIVAPAAEISVIDTSGSQARAGDNCTLSRGEYINGTLTGVRRILSDVKAVVFLRKNILSNVTNVRYEKTPK